MKEIFCRYIRKNGKYIYPKRAKYFHFFVKESPGKAGLSKGKAKLSHK